MPRPPRYNVAGVPQHVVQRGNNRQATFLDEADYRVYKDCLRAATDKHGCDVHAYVLMSNHVHLLLTPRQDGGPAKAMQSIGRRYVRHVNDRRGRTGTLWEARYRAALIESEPHLLSCTRYIELNPVRAGMVRDPADYPWSSYRHHALGEPDDVVTDHPPFSGAGADRRRAADGLSRAVSAGDRRGAVEAHPRGRAALWGAGHGALQGPAGGRLVPPPPTGQAGPAAEAPRGRDAGMRRRSSVEMAVCPGF
jgi:putative transposase